MINMIDGAGIDTIFFAIVEAYITDHSCAEDANC